MKKRLALILAALMLAATLSSCVGLFGEVDEDYTGATLALQFTDMPTSFDPMYAYIDDSASQILNLIYEGLFRYTKDGKAEKALAKSYKWASQNEKDGYVLEITLKETCWNDGTAVTAHDFVYAWRRILDPGNSSSAAPMLYQIKNAKAVKAGDVSKYDFGVTEADTRVLRIEFEENPDLDLFFTNLASPALVPLRDDVVDKINDWDTVNSIVQSCGPFYLKSFDSGKLLRFERNQYYMRDKEKNEMDDFVTPYRLNIYLGKSYEYKDINESGKEYTASIKGSSTSEMAGQLWKNGFIKYYGNIFPAERAEYADKVVSADTKTTDTLYFNLRNPLFADAKVRKALSLAIDREDLVKNTIVFATAADGIIPQGVAETVAGDKTTFRSKGGKLTSYNLEEAKKLLKEAGVTKGSFEITVKESDDVAIATAEYCAKAWKELGFNVTVRKLGIVKYQDMETGYDNIIVDVFADMFNNGGEDLHLEVVEKTQKNGEFVSNVKTYDYPAFDVMLIDVAQFTNEPFSALAPFSKKYSGGGIDLSIQQEETILVPHVTGYDSDAYDALIDEAFTATDRAARADALHRAEEMLIEDAPVVPLFTQKNAYVVSSDITGLTFDWFGNTVFTKMNDKTFVYVPDQTEEEETTTGGNEEDEGEEDQTDGE